MVSMSPSRWGLILLAYSVVACADAPEESLDIVLRFSPTPPSVGPARLLLELTDSLGAPVTGASVAVEGHPSTDPSRPTTPVQAEEQRSGRYVVATYDFDASGPWILRVRATAAGGVEVVREFETSVYGGS